MRPFCPRIEVLRQFPRVLCEPLGGSLGRFFHPLDVVSGLGIDAVQTGTPHTAGEENAEMLRSFSTGSSPLALSSFLNTESFDLSSCATQRRSRQTRSPPQMTLTRSNSKPCTETILPTTCRKNKRALWAHVR